MAKAKKNRSRARICLFVPICCFVVVAIFTAVGNYWIQISDKYQERVALKQRMVSLREKEAELKVDVEKLEDPDYVARYAREKYMYSKEGELIIRLPEEDE